MFSCIELVSSQGLVGLRLLLASRLSYELDVNGEEKVIGNQDTINKNGHRTFHNSKPANFNGLKEVI